MNLLTQELIGAYLRLHQLLDMESKVLAALRFYMCEPVAVEFLAPLATELELDEKELHLCEVP